MKLNSLLVKKSLVAVKLLISYISRVILNKLPNYKLFHALGCNSSKIFILKTEAFKFNEVNYFNTSYMGHSIYKMDTS